MPRGKRKSKKNFIKIKEKLILVPPKKFVGRKVIGVICLVLGTIILVTSSIYFFIIPRYFSKEPEVVQEIPAEVAFAAERIIIPSQGVNYSVHGGMIEGKILNQITKITKGEEIFILGSGKYYLYSVLGTEVQPGSIPSNLVSGSQALRLVLLLPGQPSKNLLIDAELSESPK